MVLSKAQRRALLFLNNINGWTNKTPVTQRCLNVLSEKGLIEVAYSQGMGWCEQITDEGKLIIVNDKNKETIV